MGLPQSTPTMWARYCFQKRINHPTLIPTSKFPLLPTFYWLPAPFLILIFKGSMTRDWDWLNLVSEERSQEVRAAQIGFNVNRCVCTKLLTKIVPQRLFFFIRIRFKPLQLARQGAIFTALRLALKNRFVFARFKPIRLALKNFSTPIGIGREKLNFADFLKCHKML